MLVRVFAEKVTHFDVIQHAWCDLAAWSYSGQITNMHVAITLLKHACFMK